MVDLLSTIATRLRTAGSFAAAERALDGGGDFTLATPGFVRPAVIASLWAAAPRPALLLVAGEDEAARQVRQLRSYLPFDSVLHFPMRANMPWSDAPVDVRLAGERARALHALGHAEPLLVVASARAMLRRVPPRDAHVFEPLALAPGLTLDMHEAAERLSRMGYERVTSAEERGQFAVRGGTLDVFAGDAAHPVRADFFGDEIETLRRYVPTTGQSVADVDGIDVFSAREVRLGTRAAQSARRALQEAARSDVRAAFELDAIEQGIYFPGVEKHLSLFYKKTAAPAEYVPEDALVVVAEPRAVFDDAARYHDEVKKSAEESGIEEAGLFTGPGGIDLGGRQRLTLLSLLRAGAAVDAELVARRPEVAGGEQPFAGAVRGLLQAEHVVLIATRDRETRRRLSETLVEAGVSVESHDGAGGPPESAATETRVAHMLIADVAAGFVVPDARLAVVSVDDVFPRAAARAGTPTSQADAFTFPFKPGDYVVHATHGIALLTGIVRREIGGAERDYLQLEYAKGDKLYVPVEQLARVTKYVGPEGTAPKVTRLNTSDWSRALTKTRKAAKKLAFDLVDLYARRASVAGHRFGTDTPWQREMDGAFPFVETPDQMLAIEAVKADMESEEPMDRLVAGDVGYGKTEVAIRAVFKAVQDGKQVMVLCPTTILAQQHFTNFTDRFAPFPVKVDLVSRFRSAAQMKAALAGFADGSIDVLIGTHRLLSADVAPKDLGLVVIDEEQRFGVEHKEHLKNLREQIDVLTLSATPIPRTLQMALSGVRDMSVIDTPPPNRYPVTVHVGEFDPDLVAGAIREELRRGGQVYYIHNRVRTIHEAVERVRTAVPEARVVEAHGKMTEHQLERVMEAFAACEFDVLVSTTIVESGIDNPHTNTLVIEDSERLGLAQLYQLKGRVGRSHVRAHAYFFFSRGASLTPEAADRLMAIREHTGLGSGLKISMRDLEIRGAGSLLGGEQSGNLSAVGFELYAQMLKEAVAEARGEPVLEIPEVRVDLPLSSYLPEEYVPGADERVAYYRRLAASVTPESVERVEADIREKHGAPPETARNLIEVSRIRALAAQAGLTSVAVVRHRVVAQPVDLDAERRGKLAAIGAVYSEKDRKLTQPIGAGEAPARAALTLVRALLQALSKPAA